MESTLTRTGASTHARKHTRARTPAHARTPVRARTHAYARPHARARPHTRARPHARARTRTHARTRTCQHRRARTLTTHTWVVRTGMLEILRPSARHVTSTVGPEPLSPIARTRSHVTLVLQPGNIWLQHPREPSTGHQIVVVVGLRTSRYGSTRSNTPLAVHPTAVSAGGMFRAASSRF
jgi:hypothetical protein